MTRESDADPAGANDRPTMADVDHTNPHTGEPFGEPFRRGPGTAPPAGDGPSADAAAGDAAVGGEADDGAVGGAATDGDVDADNLSPGGTYDRRTTR